MSKNADGIRPLIDQAENRPDEVIEELTADDYPFGGS
jgi:hypothetical protein